MTEKLPNLKFKTRPEQLLGFSPVNFLIPQLYLYGCEAAKMHMTATIPHRRTLGAMTLSATAPSITTNKLQDLLYAVCHHTKCHYILPHNFYYYCEEHHAVCHWSECHYSELSYAECHYSELSYDVCHYAEYHSAIF